jgi:hypothetical protein
MLIAQKWLWCYKHSRLERMICKWKACSIYYPPASKTVLSACWRLAIALPRMPARNLKQQVKCVIQFIYRVGGCFCTHFISHIPMKSNCRDWGWENMVAKPSTARTSRKPIRYMTIVKMLMKGIQNCIRCMRASPIPIEEVYSKWEEALFIKDLPMAFKCHCIGEENRTKNCLQFQTPLTNRKKICSSAGTINSTDVSFQCQLHRRFTYWTCFPLMAFVSIFKFRDILRLNQQIPY